MKTYRLFASLLLSSAVGACGPASDLPDEPDTIYDDATTGDATTGDATSSGGSEANPSSGGIDSSGGFSSSTGGADAQASGGAKDLSASGGATIRYDDPNLEPTIERYCGAECLVLPRVEECSQGAAYSGSDPSCEEDCGAFYHLIAFECQAALIAYFECALEHPGWLDYYCEGEKIFATDMESCLAENETVVACQEEFGWQ